MNGMPHTVNRVLGLISANFSRSAITVNRISEGVCSQQGLYTTYTLLGAIRASAGNFQLLVAKVKANIRGNTLDGLEGLRRHINLLNSCAVITY